MKTETFESAADFMAALNGKKPKKSAATARPGLPRATAGEGDRIDQLMRIAVWGFTPRYRAGFGFDFWHIDGRSTTLCASYAAACIAAEKALSFS